MPNGKPNILIIWGDDIGITNLSCYSDGLMGYRTPNIDRIANEGMRFTDAYGQQSCTAGRAAFLTGQDIHRATAATVYGVTPGDVTRQMRDTAKMVNFGIAYGMGEFGLASRTGMTREEAEAFITMKPLLYTCRIAEAGAYCN